MPPPKAEADDTELEGVDAKEIIVGEWVYSSTDDEGRYKIGLYEISTLANGELRFVEDLGDGEVNSKLTLRGKEAMGDVIDADGQICGQLSVRVLGRDKLASSIKAPDADDSAWGDDTISFRKDSKAAEENLVDSEGEYSDLEDEEEEEDGDFEEDEEEEEEAEREAPDARGAVSAAQRAAMEDAEQEQEDEEGEEEEEEEEDGDFVEDEEEEEEEAEGEEPDARGALSAAQRAAMEDAAEEDAEREEPVARRAEVDRDRGGAATAAQRTANARKEQEAEEDEDEDEDEEDEDEDEDEDGEEDEDEDDLEDEDPERGAARPREEPPSAAPAATPQQPAQPVPAAALSVTPQRPPQSAPAVAPAATRQQPAQSAPAVAPAATRQQPAQSARSGAGPGTPAVRSGASTARSAQTAPAVVGDGRTAPVPSRHGQLEARLLQLEAENRNLKDRLQAGSLVASVAGYSDAGSPPPTAGRAGSPTSLNASALAVRSGSPWGTSPQQGSRPASPSASSRRPASPGASSRGRAPPDLYRLAAPLTRQSGLPRGGSALRKARERALQEVQGALERGASASSWSGPGTPLQAAVQSGCAELTALLLAARADVATPDEKGVSLLHHAAFDGQADICRMLLKAGADVNACDCHGQTPLFFAPSRAVCETLYAGLADTNVINAKGQCALHLAGRAGLCDVMSWLLGRCSRAMLRLRDEHGLVPADYARQAGVRPEILAKLEPAGARAAGFAPPNRSAQDAWVPDEDGASSWEDGDTFTPGPSSVGQESHRHSVLGRSAAARARRPTGWVGEKVSPHQVPMACENRASRRSSLLSTQSAIRAQQDAALLVQQRNSVRQS